MDAQPISTKQLREDMPSIKAKLLEGQSFYWIDRSKPIGRIEPISQPIRKQPTMTKKAYRKYIESIAGGFEFKKSYSPEELNKIIDQQYEV